MHNRVDLSPEQVPIVAMTGLRLSLLPQKWEQLLYALTNAVMMHLDFHGRVDDRHAAPLLSDLGRSHYFTWI